jgi:hypothetical protein
MILYFDYTVTVGTFFNCPIYYNNKNKWLLVKYTLNEAYVYLRKYPNAFFERRLQQLLRMKNCQCSGFPAKQESSWATHRWNSLFKFHKSTLIHQIYNKTRLNERSTASWLIVFFYDEGRSSSATLCCQSRSFGCCMRITQQRSWSQRSISGILLVLTVFMAYA